MNASESSCTPSASIAKLRSGLAATLSRLQALRVRAVILLPVLNVVQTSPTEMSVYINRDYAQPTNHINRYTLRLDGFASVNAPYTGGEMVTRAFTFSGKELEINYATSAAGGIRVELQDASGNAIPGFTLADAQEIIGDHIARIVSWKSGSSVAALAGKPVRLRFVMKDADLYSLRFKD